MFSNTQTGFSTFLRHFRQFWAPWGVVRGYWQNTCHRKMLPTTVPDSVSSYFLADFTVFGYINCIRIEVLRDISLLCYDYRRLYSAQAFHMYFIGNPQKF